MKADEIRVGMRVGVVTAGRNSRPDGQGEVVAVDRVRVNSYSSRYHWTMARVRMYDDEWNPVYASRYEDGKFVKTDEPLVRSFRLQQVISEDELNRRNEEARKAKQERIRRHNMVEEVKEGILAVLAKAEIDSRMVRVEASYREATADDDEGVYVRSITIRDDGITQLSNFVNRELELTHG